MTNRAYKIVINPKYNASWRGLASMVHKFFDEETGSRANANEVLAQELYKLVIKIFKRMIGYARFKDNIWAADLAEMGSLLSKNQC